MSQLLNSLKWIIPAAFILITGCSHITPVKAWEKGTLASEDMRYGGPNPMIKKFDEHIYTSKEGTKGGGGVSGGGCGCN